MKIDLDTIEIQWNLLVRCLSSTAPDVGIPTPSGATPLGAYGRHERGRQCLLFQRSSGHVETMLTHDSGARVALSLLTRLLLRVTAALQYQHATQLPLVALEANHWHCSQQRRP